MSKKGEAGLLFVVSASVRDFQTEFKKVEKDLKKFGKGMQNIGSTMSMAITGPLLAMGAGAVMAFNESEKAMAQVRAGLKSTGGAAGLTEAQLQQMAVALQDISKFDDDEILKEVTANMLTFTNVVGENFKEAQLQALNLASRLDGDLQSATIMLGKALNDPIDGLKKMSRVGVQFTDDQVRMVTALQNAGDMAGAQTVILKELERQYGGSAAATLAGLGPLQQLSKLIADTSEEFGKIIFEYLAPFIEYLKEGITWIRGLGDEQKRIIVVVGALVAAVGPLLVALGFLATTLIPSLVAGLAVLTSPITLTIGAIALLGAAVLYVIDNFQAFKERFSDWNWLKNAVIDVVKFIAKAATLLLQPLFKLLNIDLWANIDKLDALKSQVEAPKTAFKSFGETASKAVNHVMDAWGLLGKKVEETTTGIDKATKAIVAFNAASGGQLSGTSPGMTPIGTQKTTVAYTKPENPFQDIKIENRDNSALKFMTVLYDKAYAVYETMKSIIGLIGTSLTSAFEASLINGENFFKVFGDALANMLKKLIAAAAAAVVLASALTLAFGGASGGLAFMGIEGKGFGGLMGGLFKGFAGIGMANGGVVPPGYPNDSYPAMLSSNEIVVPPRKLAGLTTGGGSFTVDIRGKMKGSDIVFEMERYVMNRVRNIGR